MADHYDLREVVTEAFYEHHVVSIRVPSSSDLSARDLEDAAKTEAERMYMARGVAISTLIVFGQQEATWLRSEVNSLQPQYLAAPQQIYTTGRPFPMLSRGTRGATPAALKRARYIGCFRFHYAVERVQAEHGPPFKICHFDGYVP